MGAARRKRRLVRLERWRRNITILQIKSERIEHQTVSGAHPAIALKPYIVATVKFEAVIKEPITKQLTLRFPKLVMLRPDKSALEADKLADLESLYLRQHMG